MQQANTNDMIFDVATLVSVFIGVCYGAIAGYFGGKVDALIMRIGDVILSFPTILMALRVSGIARALFPQAATAEWAPLPHELLAKISNRIINEVRGINRVAYDISSKPPATIEWE